MRVESRNTFGRPSLILIPTKDEEVLIDEILGQDEFIEIVGTVKCSDGYGPTYIELRNPVKNPHGPIRE